MTLKSRYKTDSEAVEQGVWFNFEANSDGTVPGFLMAFAGKQNVAFTAATRAWTEKYLDDTGMPNFSGVADDVIERQNREVFLRTVLKGWRNFQPEDDGTELTYSPETAQHLFGSPDWSALVDDLQQKARKAGSFKNERVELQAKNS